MATWSDLATWRGPTVNRTAGGMHEYRGVVIHIAQGSYEGTIAWQKNPDADVSSHFVCGKLAGERAQMVDTADAAWTQADGNGEWLSIEFAGFSGQLLTAPQVEFAAQILARAHKLHGVPLQVATSPSGRGLGHHSMGGVAWGNHPNCPGAPIIGQKPAIIDRARKIVTGVQEDDMEQSEKLALYSDKTVAQFLADHQKERDWRMSTHGQPSPIPNFNPDPNSRLAKMYALPDQVAELAGRLAAIEAKLADPVDEAALAEQLAERLQPLAPGATVEQIREILAGVRLVPPAQ